MVVPATSSRVHAGHINRPLWSLLVLLAITTVGRGSGKATRLLLYANDMRPAFPLRKHNLFVSLWGLPSVPLKTNTDSLLATVLVALVWKGCIDFLLCADVGLEQIVGGDEVVFQCVSRAGDLTPFPLRSS